MNFAHSFFIINLQTKFTGLSNIANQFSNTTSFHVAVCLKYLQVTQSGLHSRKQLGFHINLTHGCNLVPLVKTVSSIEGHIFLK
jgi:hypothetical protein